MIAQNQAMIKVRKNTRMAVSKVTEVGTVMIGKVVSHCEHKLGFL